MNGYDAWLNTKKLAEAGLLRQIVAKLSPSEIVKRAISELERAFGPPDPTHGIWNIELVSNDQPAQSGSYKICCDNKTIRIEAADDKAALYGCYALIKKAILGELSDGLTVSDTPKTELRMINHWDNMDGSIERGYSGRSFFFENNEILLHERITDYCRLAASVGINAVVINNVNVKEEARFLITAKHFDRLKYLSDVFHSFGISLFLSLNFAAPVEEGGLETADPLDENVIRWWDKKMAEVYRALPCLGGFLVKADSEGRPGPFTYGRNQAEGANMLGRALAPYGGILIWRAFVYNAGQDWRDTKTDRARAAYDYFAALDGLFENNVYLQIKNGPMDFQVREPVSPLFSAMTKTNLILELQITQEYTGQQIDLCYLLPQWREILDFQTGNPAARTQDTSLASILKGDVLEQVKIGIAAVSNTGNDINWFGHDLAAVNFYAYGCLAWSADRPAEETAREWAALSFDPASADESKLVDMLLASWPVYEAYTAPLGIGWMVTPHTHYGPSVDGYEYDRWGTYHRADHRGIGVDRSDQGTAYATLYPREVGEIFNRVESCPDEYVLFFHRLAYTDRLKSGKTVIQHIYDSRFWACEQVEGFMAEWESLKSKLDAKVHRRVSERFARQLINAREWRDQVNSYFRRKSGIDDEHGRLIY